jgi:hypothetical protein
MNPASPDLQARQLVHAFGSISATEDLILFVAGTDNMVAFCRNLLEQYDDDAHGPLVREVDAQCAAQAVLPGSLYAEVRKVLLALNRFHDTGGNHYEVLGLPETATGDEVKQAYRTLSKQYHPDRQEGSEKDARRFMEIAGAYHAIMDATTRHQAPAETPWRKRRSHSSGRRRRDRKKFFLGLAAIIFALVGASVFLAGVYNKKVATSRMHQYENNPAQVSGQPVSDTPSSTEAETQPLPAEPDPETEAEETYPVADQRTDQQPGEKTPSPEAPAAPQPQAGEAVQLQNPPAALPPLPGQVEQDVSGKTLYESSPPPPPGPVSRVAAVQKATRQSREDSPQVKEQQVKELQDRSRRIQTINTSLEISSLVNQYSRLYNRRDLESFLTLFAEHATENGSPLETFIDQYRSLFTHTRAIELKISDLNWVQQENAFLTRGIFDVSYTYRDGRTRNHTGNITFNLVREQNILKIRSLEYEFH